MDNEGLGVSHERIYQHIKDDKIGGGDLYRHLHCQKKRRKRYGVPSHRGHIKNRVCIDQRPDVVERCSRVGGWEADIVIGTKKAGKVVATLSERKSRYCLIVVSEEKWRFYSTYLELCKKCDYPISLVFQSYCAWKLCRVRAYR